LDRDTLLADMSVPYASAITNDFVHIHLQSLA